MESLYNEIETCNWFGDTDIDSMYEQYLGNNMDNLQKPETKSASYRHKDITQWGGKECLEWATAVLQRNGYSHHSVNLSEFTHFNGQYLLNCSRNDLAMLFGEELGEIFADNIQDLKDQSFLGNYDKHYDGSSSLDPYLPHDELSHSSYGGPILGSSPREAYGYGAASYDESSHSPFLDAANTSGAQEYSYVGPPSAELPEAIFDDTVTEELFSNLNLGGNPSTTEDFFSDTQQNEFSSTCYSDTEDPKYSQVMEADEMLKKIQASRKHRVRSVRNWEFLMRLLVNPKTNPSLIEWEDERRGIFRLRQPSIIAQIWASRNPPKGDSQQDLSYNNFARGLRHHYKKGVLRPIPERQLVYQCGPQALQFLQEHRQ